MTVDKCNKVIAFTGKWVNETDAITERGRRAIAMEPK